LGRIVIFFLSTDARNVASRKHKLCDAELQVTLLQTWPEMTSCAISVQGIGDKLSKDTVWLFFENQRRSCGGPISDYVKDEETGNVVITFENREGV
jgi:hypothetical protein